MNILHICKGSDPARQHEIDLLKRSGHDVTDFTCVEMATLGWMVTGRDKFPFDMIVCSHSVDQNGDGLEFLMYLSELTVHEEVKLILHTRVPESKIGCDFPSYRIEYLHKHNPHLLVRFVNAVAPQARMLERM